MAFDVLNRRRLGRTPFEVTALCVGTGEIDDETLGLAAYPVPNELWDELAELTPAREHWLGER